MKIRHSKEDDQDEIQKAFDILVNAAKDHPEIEATLWIGALWSQLVNTYIESAMPFDLFCEELDEVKENYKNWFEDEEEDE